MLRGTAVVSSLTLVSRVLGFVREILVARVFGGGLFADALFVAFRIPNLLRSVFAEGALTSAFVPVFAGELAKGREDARSAIRSVAGLLLTATAIVTLLGIIFADRIVLAIAPGFTEGGDRYRLCVLLTRILMPYIMCVSIVALLNGALNSVHIFGASALAQVVMNLTLIAGAIAAAFFGSWNAAIVLALSALGGGILQIVAQIPALRRSGFSLKPSRVIWSRASRSVVHLMLPAVLGAAVYQLSIFLTTQLASVLETGSVAWLSYADRLAQLPVGVFAVALSSVLLPTLSNAHARGDKDQFKGSLLDALRFSSFVMIPASLFLFMFAHPIVEILFERGRFGPADTFKTALAAQAFSVGLWAVSCHSMLVRAFNAQKDTKTPTLIGIATLCVQLFLSVFFMGRPLEEGTFSRFIAGFQNILDSFLFRLEFGHAGLALSSSLTFFCSAALLASVLKKRIASLSWDGFVHSSLQGLIAALITAFALSLLRSRVPGSMQFLLAGLPLGIGAEILLLYVMRSRELAETWAMVKKRLFARR